MRSTHLHMESVPFSGSRLNMLKCELCQPCEQCLGGWGPSPSVLACRGLSVTCWQSENLSGVALPLHTSPLPHWPISRPQPR